MFNVHQKNPLRRCVRPRWREAAQQPPADWQLQHAQPRDRAPERLGRHVEEARREVHVAAHEQQHHHAEQQPCAQHGQCGRGTLRTTAATPFIEQVMSLELCLDPGPS